MAHVEKFTGGAMGHMLQHYDRTKEVDNIDKARSCLNYNLAGSDQPTPQLAFIHRRLSEVRVQNRKDVNKLCDWVVTVPKDLPQSEHKRFFAETYDFLRDKYGVKNVVSAYVHMDEVTPHMHFAFVPVVADQRRGGEKLSAKEAITKIDLQQFHDKLQERLESRLGHPVNIQNGATQDGNKSIAELKRNTAVEQIAAIRVESSRIVSEARKEVEQIEEQAIPLKAEYEARRGVISHFNKDQYEPYAKITKKGVFDRKEYVTIPKEKWDSLMLTAYMKRDLAEAMVTLDQRIFEFQQTASGTQLTYYRKQISNLTVENNRLKVDLKSAKADAAAAIDKVNRILDKLPPQTAQEFIKAWQAESYSYKPGIKR